MYRSHHCGELRIGDAGKEVTLSAWVSRSRNLGGLTFVDLRDRYGLTQLTFNMDEDEELCKMARALGREDVVSAKGTVRERSSKNPELPTGEIEIEVNELRLLSKSKVPPFTIEEETDGGEELRMQYRYLDLRRPTLQRNMIFRSRIAQGIRSFLSQKDFIEIETPFLIKSTPEGARDFIVPSRMHKGSSYALPQSPQTFKQLLMVSGYDKYFQIVKCFRDEDLRADRQPEFTQLDCEMSFVEQEDVLQCFEDMVKQLFADILKTELPDFPRMPYDEAIAKYGSDKPDTRFGMEIQELNEQLQGEGFKVFDNAETVCGILAEGQAENYSNKDLKKLTKWAQRPQIGAAGLVYILWKEDGSIKSSVSKFYSDEKLIAVLESTSAKPGDMLLVLCGEKSKTLTQMGALRLEMGERMALKKEGDFSPLWVLDFPLLEWDEESNRFHAMHHPFTAPKEEDISKFSSEDRENLSSIRANAYDLVINGAEIGGGSIRIHRRELQEKNFELLGFTEAEAREQFGFLLDAFQYGAPPHGGIAFGFDRFCAVMSGQQSIRDFIAFPKNNQGRDLMLNAPSAIEKHQLLELGLFLRKED